MYAFLIPVFNNPDNEFCPPWFCHGSCLTPPNICHSLSSSAWVMPSAGSSGNICMIALSQLIKFPNDYRTKIFPYNSLKTQTLADSRLQQLTASDGKDKRSYMPATFGHLCWASSWYGLVGHPLKTPIPHLHCLKHRRQDLHSLNSTV